MICGGLTSSCIRCIYKYSISAVLTLLVSAIVRPLDETVAQDLQRVEAWLRVIDKLATDSERPDLLEQKDFLDSMKQWALRVVQEATYTAISETMHFPSIQENIGTPTLQLQLGNDENIWNAPWIQTDPDLSPGGQFGPSFVSEDWLH